MERERVWDWPIQQRPTQWATWKKLTRVISQYNTLLKPLGQWITTKEHQRQDFCGWLGEHSILETQRQMEMLPSGTDREVTI
jgi:hypothetical protein